MAVHPLAPSASPHLPASLAKAGLALCAAALIVFLGDLMASQLPDPDSPAPTTPAALYGGVSSHQPPIAPSPNALPTGPRDLNGGSRGFSPNSLTVNQRLP